MNPYPDMYKRIFNIVTDTIVALQQVQQECEAMFIEGTPENAPDLTVMHFPPPEDEKL